MKAFASEMNRNEGSIDKLLLESWENTAADAAALVKQSFRKI